MTKASFLEETLALQLRAEKIPFVREVRGLVPGRKFRVDFLVKDWLVIECNGGIWNKGGHSSGAGITRDYEKVAELLCMGYPSIGCSRGQIESGAALEWIKRVLENYGKVKS